MQVFKKPGISLVTRAWMIAVKGKHIFDLTEDELKSCVCDLEHFSGFWDKTRVSRCYSYVRLAKKARNMEM